MTQTIPKITHYLSLGLLLYLGKFLRIPVVLWIFRQCLRFSIFLNSILVEQCFRFSITVFITYFLYLEQFLRFPIIYPLVLRYPKIPLLILLYYYISYSSLDPPLFILLYLRKWADRSFFWRIALSLIFFAKKPAIRKSTVRKKILLPELFSSCGTVHVLWASNCRGLAVLPDSTWSLS